MPFGFTDQPCKQDCPNRSAECRRTCIEWAKFEFRKRIEYERRLKLGEETSAQHDMDVRRFNRFRRMNKR